MRGEHLGEVHAVELVAGEDQHVLDARLRAGGAGSCARRRPCPGTSPACSSSSVERLLGGEDFDEAAAEVVEAVRAADVAVQAHRLELREHVDLVDLAVDAVRERDVDQPILAGQRHGRLRAIGRERQQPRAATAAQNYSDDVFHRLLP